MLRKLFSQPAKPAQIPSLVPLFIFRKIQTLSSKVTPQQVKQGRQQGLPGTCHLAIKSQRLRMSQTKGLLGRKQKQNKRNLPTSPSISVPSFSEIPSPRQSLVNLLSPLLKEGLHSGVHARVSVCFRFTYFSMDCSFTELSYRRFPSHTHRSGRCHPITWSLNQGTFEHDIG